MLGIDDYLIAQGGGWAFVLLIAVLLGLRHATDPDHLTALLTLRLNRRQNPHLIGLGWGIGHALTMIAVGVPTILLASRLPEQVQQALELAIGLMIMAMGTRALLRLRRATTHRHGHHHHDGTNHDHPHSHGSSEHAHRTPMSAFAVGLLHGAGGSAGAVGLILSALEDRTMACLALVVIAVFSGASMMICSWVMCAGVDRVSGSSSARLITGIGSALAVVFGAWYCLAATTSVWYPF
jgi:hypothetical protein